MAGTTTLLGDQIKLPIKEQLSRLEKAVVFGYIDSSKTEPSDFFQLADHGADVLLMDSGVVLQNLAIRSTINRLARRPLLLWMKRDDDTKMDYVLDESLEAGISGADGIVFKSSELKNTGKLSENIKLLHEYGLSSIVQASTEEDVKLVAELSEAPDAVVTAPTVQAQLNGILQIPMTESSGKMSKVDTPTLFSTVEHMPDVPARQEFTPLVKVCGIQTVDAARVACENGADMIGMILVPNRSRTVNLPDARAVCTFVKQFDRQWEPEHPHGIGSMSISEANAHVLRSKARKRPLVVGVFRNQPLAEVLAIQQDLELDLVQLHGSEPLSWCRMIPCPVIRRFTPNTPEFETSSIPGYHYASLLDSEKGGEGKLVDWSAVNEQVELGARFILAGGLTPENVQQALQTPGVFGVDVSGGVETNGTKDPVLIEQFIQRAKSAKVFT